MKLRHFSATLLSLIVLVIAGTLAAQTADKVWRIAYLTPGAGQTEYTRSFVEAMRALGYVEGRNVVYDFRGARNDSAQVGPLAREIVAARPDVVVAGGVIAVGALRKVSTAIPIVASSTVDPVALGFAASLSHPGGNITGIANLADELLVKQMEMLSLLLPRVKRVAVMLNPVNPVSAALKERAAAVAGLKGWTLVFHEAQDAKDIIAAFRVIEAERPDGVIVATDAALFSQSSAIVAEAARLRLPAVYPIGERWVSAGGLASYGPRIHDIYRRAASYVDRILKGAKPGELPMEQPTTFELALNLKTARALGITVPRSVLLRADRVIE